MRVLGFRFGIWGLRYRGQGLTDVRFWKSGFGFRDSDVGVVDVHL